MPVLSNVDEKYVDGYRVDKETDDVIYSDEQHVYIDKHDKEKYVSVTTLIHKYINEFDSDFWSSYKACEALSDNFFMIKELLLSSKRWNDKYLDQLNLNKETFNAKKQEILRSYDEERIKSCERGTKIHAEIENEFYKSEEQEFNKYGQGGKFMCKKGYYHLDLDRGIYPEFLISYKDDDIRLAGQVDLLIKDDNEITIVDHKSSKKINLESFYDRKTKSRTMMKFPLNNLMDCNYITYTLQLSTYAYMLQKLNPNFVIKKLIINHIDHSNNITEYECEYLKDDVERMIKHYKRDSLIRSILDLDKPIVF